jgi:surface polysaccharide O-acyltransferase-like enzyme
VSTPAAVTRRYVEIDVLKLVAIVTVVLIHGVRPPWDPALSPTEVWLGHLTRFAVPAFLFASGFLYATRDAVPAATTLRRLRRVLVPYLLASLGAQLWWHALGQTSPGGHLALDLLFGSSFGPYYYVFVAALLVAVTPGVPRLPARALPALAVGLGVAQWAVDAALAWPLPFYWHLRNPLLWWAYFAAGWLLRLHYAALAAWVTARRRPLAVGLALAATALTAASGLPGPLVWVRSAAWLEVWVILALLLTLSCGARRSPAALRWVSDATYGVYLLHLFFLYAVQLRFPPSRGDAASILLPWAAGLGGSLVVIAGLQRLLGRRSRDLIGA